MTTPQIWEDVQSQPQVPVNENWAALGQAFVWAHDVEADTGLTVGLAGGVFDGAAVAHGTLACTDNATNYVVVHRATRVASTQTATTNWNDVATYGRIARAVFVSGALTWHDERCSKGGIFDHAQAAVASRPLIFPVSYVGKPTAGQTIFKMTAPIAFTFGANLSGSKPTAADAAATASAVVELLKNGAQVATLTYAAAGVVPTLATSGGVAVAFAVDDIMTVKAPASADATLSGIYTSLIATQGV